MGTRAIDENDFEDQVFEDETNHNLTDEAVEQEFMEQQAQQQMRALDEEMVTALERTHPMTTDVRDWRVLHCKLRWGRRAITEGLQS